MNRTFVIAGTYRQYTDWCRVNGRGARDADLVAVITSVPDAYHRLRGYVIDEEAGDRVVRVGTYRNQRYAWQALQALEIAQRGST